MSSREVEHAVIGMLTAWRQAVAELTEDDTGPPPDLLAALGAPAVFTGEASFAVARDPVPLAEVRRIAQDAVREAVRQTETHYARVIGYMAYLFSFLADEAAAVPGFDLGEFLQRQALQLAAMDDEQDGGSA